jgi:thiamine phosphate synthase YjbQ (UPF0047 family)
MWIQKELSLRPRSRDFHLVTTELLASLPEIGTIRHGLLHLFIKHTPASLTINENKEGPNPADDADDLAALFAGGQSPSCPAGNQLENPLLLLFVRDACH